MEFKKYPSIENHYQTKFIRHFADKFGNEILSQPYIAREKLDGANIQLVFQPKQELLVGKRTSYLEKTDSFFDIWNTLNKYSDFIAFFQEKSDSRNNVLRVYGEIYGPGINGRIDYGQEKRISIFDVMVNDEFASQQALDEQFEIDGFAEMLPKTYGIFNNLEDALNIAFPSNTEGAVIQPLNNVYFSPNGSRLIIKKKADEFYDIDGKKEEKPEAAFLSPLNIAFRGYINENRVKDVFSKHGEIDKPQQIPDYIKLVLEDAKIDFLKNYDIEKLIPDFDKKKEKEVFNVGGSIVEILKRYL